MERMRQRVRREAKLIAVSFALMLMGSGRVLADVNLVTNGSFESKNFSGWTQSGDTNSGDVYVAKSGTGGPNGSQGYTSEDGSYLALLGPPYSLGYLSQSISTVAGQSYTFTFYIASNGENPDELQASWNGTSVLDLKNISNTHGSYLAETFTEKATSSTTQIKFGFYDTQSYLALDNVSVVANAVSTPEPSTAVIGLIGGVAMTGWIWRVRRRQSATL